MQLIDHIQNLRSKNAKQFVLVSIVSTKLELTYRGNNKIASTLVEEDIVVFVFDNGTEMALKKLSLVQNTVRCH